MKDRLALLHFLIVRRLERRLSVPALYRVVLPYARIRAMCHKPFRTAHRTVPACLGPSRRVPFRDQLRNNYLNRVLAYFPEQLGTPKWIHRCRFAGLERLQRARQNGRPVVLAFWHCGPYALLRPWLRAAGFPAVTLVQGRSEDRCLWKRLADRAGLFPETPTALYQDQLRETVKRLTAGNPLLIALDGAAGKQMKVPMNDQWVFRMATGPIRLAIRYQADLLPCSLVDEGEWRFHFEIGRPVPAEILAAEDLVNAGQHLLGELFPHLQAQPDACQKSLLKHFEPVTRAVSGTVMPR